MAIDICLFVQLFLLQTCALVPKFQPPKMVEFSELNETTTFIEKEKIAMTCQAHGNPQPKFQWFKDEYLLVSENFQSGISGVKFSPGNGTLVMESTTHEHEGVYRCVATNELGRAFGKKTELRMAVLDTPSVSPEVVLHRLPATGNHVVMRCQAPRSWPSAKIYWTVAPRDQINDVKNVETNDRVAVDYEGRLHLTSVLLDDIYRAPDSRDDRHFFTSTEAPDVSSVLNSTSSSSPPSSPSPTSSSSSSSTSTSTTTSVESETKPLQSPATTRHRPARNSSSQLIYSCVAFNPTLRRFVQGQNQAVDPLQGDLHRLTSQALSAPRLLWSSANEITAFIGASLSIKCIFTGFPTPQVSWYRHGPENIFQQIHKGQELTFTLVTLRDEGRYQCQGRNGILAENGSNVARFQIKIESLPRWKNGVPPQDVVAVEDDEEAEVVCSVEGIPEPIIEWFRNGEPINESDKLITKGSKVIIKNITTSDICVFQCQSSNGHGTITKNIILNVLAQAPTLYHTPSDVIKVSEGQPIRARCKAVGAPRPTFRWKTPDLIGSLDGRVTVSTNQDESLLVINETAQMDGGMYRCMAINKFGEDFATFEIIVRLCNFNLIERSKILDDWTHIGKFIHSRGMVVITTKRNGSFNLNCSATSDQREMDSLNITWFYQKINKILKTCEAKKVGSVGKIFICELFISSVGSQDGGVYVCDASTGLDRTAQKFYLNVQDAPDPPINVRLVSCTSTQATLSWQPGNDNHDPISKYAVFYGAEVAPSTESESAEIPNVRNETQNKQPSSVEGSSKIEAEAPKADKKRTDTPIEIIGRMERRSLHSDQSEYSDGMVLYPTVQVPAYQRVVRLKLHPNFRYSFEMKAYNTLGWSRPSDPESCVTKATTPFRNPDRVCCRTGPANDVLVTWQPLQFHELNGGNFRYLIKHKMAHDFVAMKTVAVVIDWRQNSTSFKIRQPANEYLNAHVISLLSLNDHGMASADLETMTLCYAGQKEPLDPPRNFQINLSSVTNNSAQFIWHHVDTNVTRIRGHFLGYRIRLWKTLNPMATRNVSLILSPWKQCSTINSSDDDPDDDENDEVDEVDEDVFTRITTSSPVIFRKKYRVHHPEGFQLVTMEKQSIASWSVGGLWPNTDVSASLVVLNGEFEGPSSKTVRFLTKEGVPEGVAHLKINEVGSRHVWISWKEPNEINGVLIGYTMAYKLAPPSMSSLVELNLHSTESDYILTDVQPSSSYLIYIWARTRSGRSKESILEVKTADLGEPDEPVVTSVERGDNWMFVSWNVSVDQSPRNPGLHFRLEFMNINKSTDGWNVLDVMDGRRKSMNITNDKNIITSTDDYHIRVVAITDESRKKESKMTIAKANRDTMIRKESSAAASSSSSAAAAIGWTFGLLFVIALFLAAAYFLYRFKFKAHNRYHVYAKEATKGNLSNRKATMDRNFREFKKFSLRLLRNRSEMKNGHFYLKENASTPIDIQADVKADTQADNQSYAVSPRLHSSHDEQHERRTSDRPASMAWEDDQEIVKMLLQRNSLSLLLDNDTHLNFNEDGSFIGVYVGKRNSGSPEDEGEDGDSGLGGGGGGGGEERGLSTTRNGVVIDGNIYSNGIRLNADLACGKHVYENAFERVDDLSSGSYNVRSSTAILGHKNGKNYKEQCRPTDTKDGILHRDSREFMPSKRRKRKPGEERRIFQDDIRDDHGGGGGGSAWLEDRHRANDERWKRPENLYVIQDRPVEYKKSTKREEGKEVAGRAARASFGDDLIDSASFLDEISEVLNMSLS